MQLESADGARLDRLLWLHHQSLDQDGRFQLNSSGPLHHLPRHWFPLRARRNHALDSFPALSQLNESNLGALHSGVLEESAKPDSLSHMGLSQVFQSDVFQLLGRLVVRDGAIVFFCKVFGGASSSSSGLLCCLSLGRLARFLGFFLGLGFSFLCALLRNLCRLGRSAVPVAQSYSCRKKLTSLGLESLGRDGTGGIAVSHFSFCWSYAQRR